MASLSSPPPKKPRSSSLSSSSSSPSQTQSLSSAPTSSSPSVKRGSSPKRSSLFNGSKGPTAAQSAALAAAEAELQSHTVFKSSTRAKKLFKSWDLDEDSYLSKTEFVNGMRKFIATGPGPAVILGLGITLTHTNTSLEQQQQQLSGTKNLEVMEEKQESTNPSPSATSFLPPIHSSSSSSSFSPSSTTTSNVLPSFLSSPPSLSDSQLDCLWAETDLNQDNRLSWAEFQYRFAGGPDPRLKQKQEKKVTQPLQSPRKKKEGLGLDGVLNGGEGGGVGKLSVSDLKAIIDGLFQDGARRYKSIDIAKFKSITPSSLKTLVNSILICEKESATKQERPMEDWAIKGWSSGGGKGGSGGGPVSLKEVEKLFVLWDEKKLGRFDFTSKLEQAKNKSKKGDSGGGKKKSNKKKGGSTSDSNKSGSVSYTLTTVRPESIRDWVSELLLQHMTLSSQAARVALEAGTAPMIAIDTDTGAPLAKEPLGPAMVVGTTGRETSREFSSSLSSLSSTGSSSSAFASSLSSISSSSVAAAAATSSRSSDDLSMPLDDAVDDDGIEVENDDEKASRVGLSQATIPVLVNIDGGDAMATSASSTNANSIIQNANGITLAVDHTAVGVAVGVVGSNHVQASPVFHLSPGSNFLSSPSVPNSSSVTQSPLPLPLAFPFSMASPSASSAFFTASSSSSSSSSSFSSSSSSSSSSSLSSSSLSPFLPVVSMSLDLNSSPSPRQTDLSFQSNGEHRNDE